MFPNICQLCTSHQTCCSPVRSQIRRWHKSCVCCMGTEVFSRLFLQCWSGSSLWVRSWKLKEFRQKSPQSPLWPTESIRLSFLPLIRCIKSQHRRLAKRLIWRRTCKTRYWFHWWRQMNYITRPHRIDSVGHQTLCLIMEIFSGTAHNNFYCFLFLESLI